MFGRKDLDRELRELLDGQELLQKVAADPRVQSAAAALSLVSSGVSYEVEEFDLLADVSDQYDASSEVISAALAHNEPSLEDVQ